MTNTQYIHNKLDKMLETPKARGFLNHLIKAYFPVSNVTKVEAKPKGDFKCSLTNVQLISMDEILEGVHSDAFKNDLLAFCKTMFNEKVDNTTPMATLIGEKKLAVTGKNTSTYLTYVAFQELYNWVLTQSLKGDKHINWLLNDVKRSNNGKSIAPAYKVQRDIPVIENVPATFQLGDLGVLAGIKAKIEEQIEDKIS